MNRPTPSQCIRVMRYQQACWDWGLIDEQTLTLNDLLDMKPAEVSDHQSRLEQMLQQSPAGRVVL